MSSVREKLSNMFTKVMVGTVTREEGTMLLNHMAKENLTATLEELSYLVENPPSNVFPKTILHTIALARNKAFFSIIVGSLNSRNEEVSILAAEELAGLRSEEARHVLTEYLNNEIYYVRKASAAALAKGFGDAGVETLKKHIMTHHEPFYRITSAHGLILSGRKGIDALIQVLLSGNQAAAETSAEAIASAANLLSGEDIPKIIAALSEAGDMKDAPLITSLLKAVAGFKGRARNFEGYVLAFEDYPVEAVRREAKNTIKQLRTENP